MMRVTSLMILMAAGIFLNPPSASAAATLTIPGTGACEAVLRNLATVYERSHPMARIAIPPSVHSEGGIRQVIDGRSVLARVSRPLTPEEAGKGLAQRVFARDAIVFAVGADVRARNLTIRQLAEIFSGKIVTWNQLNGGNGPIRVLYRQAGDSDLMHLQAAFKEFGDLRFAREGKVLYYDHEMLKMLRKYGNSVGFITLSTINESGAPISSLPLDGVAPTTVNIAGGRYPLVTEHSFVYRKGALPPEAREFIDFLFSAGGRKSLSGLGLVPVGR